MPPVVWGFCRICDERVHIVQRALVAPVVTVRHGIVQLVPGSEWRAVEHDADGKRCEGSGGKAG